MAVNSIIFGGVDSADYGIYISGEGVFDAPKRDVEMIEIPGRNGAFALDNGRFENIEVTYPAFNFEPNDYETFAQNLSDFRNALCSQKGYQRLTDSFHPDEYRMAVYKDGLEIKPVKYNTASEFTITFDCKPQRWLMSGEAALDIASGSTLMNPTLFESSPLLEIEGTGDIEFNGYTVSIESSDIGEVVIPYTQSGANFTLDLSRLNTGDTFTVSGMQLTSDWNYTDVATIHIYSKLSITLPSGWTTGRGYNASRLWTSVHLPDITLTLGTAYTSHTAVVSNGASGVKISDSTGTSWTTTVRATLSYDGASTLTLSVTLQESLSPRSRSTSRYVGNITGYSTKPYDYGTIYCDTDIGEFYRIEGGEYVSMNHVGDLGSDLPTLASGTNTVTYDNTITELNITPRWWKI